MDGARTQALRPLRKRVSPASSATEKAAAVSARVVEVGEAANPVVVVLDLSQGFAASRPATESETLSGVVETAGDGDGAPDDSGGDGDAGGRTFSSSDCGKKTPPGAPENRNTNAKLTTDKKNIQISRWEKWSDGEEAEE